MAITPILRRSISSVLSVVVRTVQRNRHYSALYNDSLSHKPRPRPFASTFHFYSSSAEILGADDKLVRAIESKIKSIEESDDHEAKEGAPDGFPFEIQDNPGELTISLAREYEGEVIKVKVYLSHVTGEGDATNNIPLVVWVSKRNGTKLKFRCTGVPDEIIINSLYVEDCQISPFIPEMDENTREAFQKYLEMRGIKPSLYNFLCECTSKKKSKEGALWLNNVKQFVCGASLK